MNRILNYWNEKGKPIKIERNFRSLWDETFLDYYKNNKRFEIILELDYVQRDLLN